MAGGGNKEALVVDYFTSLSVLKISAPAVYNLTWEAVERSVLPIQNALGQNLQVPLAYIRLVDHAVNSDSTVVAAGWARNIVTMEIAILVIASDGQNVETLLHMAEEDVVAAVMADPRRSEGGTQKAEYTTLQGITPSSVVQLDQSGQAAAASALRFTNQYQCPEADL